MFGLVTGEVGWAYTIVLEVNQAFEDRVFEGGDIEGKAEGVGLH